MSPETETASPARQRVEEFTDRVGRIRASLHEVVVGQDDVIDQLLVCALTGSHALVVRVRPSPVYALLTRQPASQRPSSSHYLECALAPERHLGQEAGEKGKDPTWRRRAYRRARRSCRWWAS